MSAITTLNTVEHHIGGKSTAGDSTRRSTIWNPATGEPQAEVLLAEANDVDLAVRSAKIAFESWREVSLAVRARVMFAFRELLVREADVLARHDRL